MKKSLIRTLARLAKDGDAETVAEFIEAMAGETAETAEAPETQETPAEETVTVEVPENHEITIDGDAFSALLQRLDSLIALLSAGLTPAEPAADDDPVEEIVEEVLEAAKSEGKTAAEAEGEALTTVSGGNLVRAEVNRNMQSPRCGAETIEAAVAEMMESAAEPAVSVTIEQKEEDCGGPDSAAAKDALRAVLKTFRPVLAQMSPKERRRACAELAANLRSGGRANDTGVYASLASARKAPANLNDLGRRIMAARNPNYHK